LVELSSLGKHPTSFVLVVRASPLLAGWVNAWLHGLLYMTFDDLDMTLLLA
jgi:hypothetical protein